MRKEGWEKLTLPGHMNAIGTEESSENLSNELIEMVGRAGIRRAKRQDLLKATKDRKL